MISNGELTNYMKKYTNWENMYVIFLIYALRWKSSLERKFVEINKRVGLNKGVEVKKVVWKSIILLVECHGTNFTFSKSPFQKSEVLYYEKD